MGIKDARDHPMRTLLDAREFLLIPPYQRRYSWKKDQWQDLWSDIQNLDINKKHFFGSIVLMTTKYKSQGIQTLEVVDGQQRITTITILLCAIRDYFKKQGKEYSQTLNSLANHLFVKDNDGKVIGSKLQLGNLDDSNFKAVLDGKNDYVDDEDHNDINDAYDFFVEQLENLVSDDVKKLRDKILDNLIYVSIVVDQDIDVYRLFETMNNRGLTLSEVDLIKNFIFSHGLEKEKLDSEYIKEKWTKVVINIDGINEERFFRQYLMSKKEYQITEKISVTNLFAIFKKLVNKGFTIQNLLIDIVKESKQYKKLFFGKLNCFDKNMNDLVNLGLKDIKVNSETPFTLFLSMLRNSNEPKLFLEVIRLTNTLLIRGRITDKRTSVLDSIFQHLAQKAFKQPDPLVFIRNYYRKSKYYSDDNNFERDFQKGYFPNSDRTKYILDTIEEMYFGKGGKKLKIDIVFILNTFYLSSFSKYTRIG